MSSDFALDLRVQRRQAGFTQDDVALLLGVQQSRISDLEHGRAMPTVFEICSLSLIFGRTFESLFTEIMAAVREGIARRLDLLPETGRSYVGTFNRDASIKKLARRLAAESKDHGTE